MSRYAALVALALASAACATGSGDRSAPAPEDRPDLLLYVGLESEDAVAVVDPGAGELLRKIPVGLSAEEMEGVHALVVSPDGEHYYVALAHGWPHGSVWKMATAKDSLAGRTGVGLFPATMAITPDGTWLFVANYNLHGDPRTDTVSAIHTPTMTEVERIPVCTKPHGMAASSDGRWVYASCTRDDGIRKIAVSSLSVVDSMSARTAEDRAAGRVCYAAGLALSADDSELYVACHRSDEVRVVPTARFGTIAATIPTGKGPYLLRTGPEGRVWVPNRNGSSYTVIDPRSRDAIATRPSSASHPHTFAFGPDGTAYLSMESRAVVPGAVDVIDPVTLETVRSIEVGLQATGIGTVTVPSDRSE